MSEFLFCIILYLPVAILETPCRCDSAFWKLVVTIRVNIQIYSNRQKYWYFDDRTVWMNWGCTRITPLKWISVAAYIHSWSESFKSIEDLQFIQRSIKSVLFLNTRPRVVTDLQLMLWALGMLKHKSVLVRSVFIGGKHREWGRGAQASVIHVM